MISNIQRQSAVFAAKRPQAAAAAAPAQEAAAASAAPADGVQISATQGGFNLSAMMAETAKEAASLEGKLTNWAWSRGRGVLVRCVPLAFVLL